MFVKRHQECAICRASSLVAFLSILFFALGTAEARESTRSGEGGSIDAFTGLLGTGAWVAGGRVVAEDDVTRFHAGPSLVGRARATTLVTTYSQPYRELDGFDAGSLDVVTDKLPLINLGFSYGQVRVGGIREASGGALTGRTFDATMQAVSVAVAPKRASQLGYGAQFNVLDVSIRNGGTTRFGFDLGADYSFDSARVQVNLRNLSADGDDIDALPMAAELRGEWSPYNELHLAGAVSMREEGDGEFNLGIQYDLYDLVSILAGYTSASRAWSAGAIVHYRGVNLQYGLQSHHELEYSHTVSLGVAF
jgi:hypothetical protein